MFLRSPNRCALLYAARTLFLSACANCSSITSGGNPCSLSSVLACHAPEPMPSLHIPVIPKPAQRSIDCVLRHRPIARQQRRKYIPPPTRQRINLAQNLRSLPRQRHDMLLSHIHPCRGNAPFAAVQIELAPVRRAQFPGRTKTRGASFNANPVTALCPWYP